MDTRRKSRITFTRWRCTSCTITLRRFTRPFVARPRWKRECPTMFGRSRKSLHCLIKGGTMEVTKEMIEKLAKAWLGEAKRLRSQGLCDCGCGKKVSMVRARFV